MAFFDVVGLNRSWVLFGNCCGGGVSSEEPEEIGMSRDFLRQFPIEKDRGRSQRERERERERDLACSAFENIYNLQFSCNLQEHIFQQKICEKFDFNHSTVYTAFFFSSFYLCFAFASRMVLGIILLLSLFAQIRFC